MSHPLPARGDRGHTPRLSLPARARSVLRIRPCAVFALVVAVAGCGASPESQLEDARAMQEVGEFAESVEPLRAVLSGDPGHPEANYRLGIALARTKQTNAAIWHFLRAAESSELAVPSDLALAPLYLGLQDYEAALAAVGRVLEVQPDNTAALSQRYKYNLEAKRREAALSDLDRLLQFDPNNGEWVYARAVTLGELGRVEESEAAHRQFMEVAASSNEPGLAARACAAYALAFRDYAHDAERAEQELEHCLETHPGDSLVVNQLLQVYDEADREEDALALVRKHFEASPEELSRRVNLANRLRGMGRDEEGEALLAEAVSEFGGVAEQLALAEFYRSEGKGPQALEVIEQVFEEVGQPRSDQARFIFADILLEAGKIERAEEVAADLQDPVYRQLIEGRSALMRGDVAKALQTLDAAVQQWPDNAGARYLAGFAALQAGEIERAISHLREAERADRGATDATLILARIYFQRGDYGEASRFARSYVRERRSEQPEGYVLWARALRKQGETEAALKVIERLEEEAGHPMEAAVERASLKRETDGPAAALAVIERSGIDLTDAANEPALRSLAQDLLALGRSDEAMARVEAALRAHPDAATLHALEGRLLALRGDSDAARAAFEQARELDPDLAQTLAGQASLAALTGESERAVQLFDDAVRADPGDSASAYAAAQLVLGAGQKEEAERRLREIVARDPGVGGARNDLAWLLAESGRELDRALELAEEAVRIDPQPALIDTLGYVHLQRGEAEQAAAAFRRSLEAEPNAPSVRYRLGLALVKMGDSEGARAAFEKALAAGPFPESEAAKSELGRLAQP